MNHEFEHAWKETDEPHMWSRERFEDMTDNQRWAWEAKRLEVERDQAREEARQYRDQRDALINAITTLHQAVANLAAQRHNTPQGNP